MKKQVNSTAYLIRGAFYLLLLIAVCAIPFALAQRNVIKRGVASKFAAIPANAAAQEGGYFKSASQSDAGSQLLPYDVRGVPDLPRLAQFPEKNSGIRAAHIIPILRSPKPPQVVLYDQYDNAGTNASFSGTFADFRGFDADFADDFVVPAGQTWNVESIDADGLYFNGAGPATDWNVFIYADNAGLPGAQVFSATKIPISQVGTTFTANLSPAAVLNSGTYWIKIQANMTFGTQGEWGWTDRTVQSNQGAAFRNSGGDFGCGTDWVRKPVCVTTAGGPDQVYRINGTTGGVGSPMATPTGTPSGCVINGSIDTSDPTQIGRLFRRDIPQTCPASTTCSIFGDGLLHHYDSYTFANKSGSTQCVTIDTNTACTGTNSIFTGAYLGSFDPNNICTNWIGDSGFSPNPDASFQVDVDNGETLVVVVSEVTPGAGCPAYTLTITGLCAGGTATPTATATATATTSATPTPTATATATFNPTPTATATTSATPTATATATATFTPTGTATATPTASPSCTPIVINGSIDLSDPTQVDHLNRSGSPQTCPPTTTCAIFGDGLLHHYDSYTFTNTSGSTQCVTIDTNSACTGVRFIFTAAYLGSFDPKNICTNWIGDSGFSPDPDQAFQVDLDDGQTLVVVVSNVTFNGTCPAYTLTITGLCGGGTPTPSPTATATATATPTPTATATATFTPTATATATQTSTPSPTATATPSASPSCTPQPIVINGSIDLSDPTQVDHLNRSGIPQTCPASNSCEVAGDQLLHHYDSYTFTNTSGSSQCVTIDTNSACSGVRFIFTAAYLGSFDPKNICTNWIGDSGSSPDPDQAFQVEVPDGQTLVVVVSNFTANGTCPAYTLTVSGLCGAFTPSPTPTFTPSPTPTASNTPRMTPTPRVAPTPRPRPTPAPRP